jgi:aminotransferase
MNDLIYVCAPSPLQYGVAKGISQLNETFYQSLSREYAAKRQQLCSTLTEIGLIPYIPQGAYYVLANVSALPGRNSKERAMFLLEQTGVASVPGEAFFHNGEGNSLVRFCFAKSDSELEQACSQLERLASIRVVK